jgi:hypothetical protein
MHMPKLSLKHKLPKNTVDGSHKHHHVSSRIQDLCNQLSNNTLTEFELGLTDNELHSKRDLSCLLKVVQGSDCRSIKSISIGWRLHRRDLSIVLSQLLPLILSKSKLQKLQLVLDSWVPESTLWRLLDSTTLTELVVGATRIKTRCVSDPRDDCQQKEIYQDDSIINIIHFLGASVKSLALVNCELCDDHVNQLLEALQQRVYPIQHLSLRHNRALMMSDWTHRIFQSLPQLRSLNVSLCDLDPADGHLLAQALRNAPSNSNLERLSVAGNYRMTIAIPELVDAASTRLQQLDCSFCDVQDRILSQVFEILATTSNCTLQSFICQASRVMDSTALVNCIQHNKSLRSLVLNHPKEPYSLSEETLQAICGAMPYNYTLEQLIVDCKNAKSIEPFEVWFALNRCGRRLVHQGFSSNLQWGSVLEKAAAMDDPNILYWLVQNGAEQFVCRQPDS